jgi:glycosyltransferase involved in cell wall biosynthesis
MRDRVTMVIAYEADSAFERQRAHLHRLLGPVPTLGLRLDPGFSGAALNALLDSVATEYFLLLRAGLLIEIGERSLVRLLQVAEESGAGIVYADYFEARGDELLARSVNDYQLGSVSEEFEFGPILLFSQEIVRRALRREGAIPSDLRWAGLYDLRLKVATVGEIVRVPECLAICRGSDAVLGEGEPMEEIFRYVDPRNRSAQQEMERVFTEHLRRLGAYLEPTFAPLPSPEGEYPVLASIVIPVRNRERTIADAVRSALSQRTSFPYNVIVVDNHSTDRTTEILRRWASTSPRLVHKIPERRDLGIGGCWNEAIFAPECGLLAVQLDSDDLYAGEDALEAIVRTFFDPEAFRRAAWERPCREWPTPRYALVIGAYRTVDFQLQEIPPGVVDHREWTRENGRNNALRVRGLGAPRAYYVPLLRRFGFPNVSYGEDYAVCLRLSREYEIGRLFEPIYLARRWEDNTDRALPWEVKNRYEAYKDWVRTVEIRARQRRNRRTRDLCAEEGR